MSALLEEGKTLIVQLLLGGKGVLIYWRSDGEDQTLARNHFAVHALWKQFSD